VAGPVGVEELAARLVDALVSVGAEVIALGLEQIGGQSVAAIGVVEVQSGAEGRRGQAFPGGGGHRVAPPALAAFNLALEIAVEHQIGQFCGSCRRPP